MNPFLYFQYHYDLVRIATPSTVVERCFTTDDKQHNKLLLNPATKQWSYRFGDQLILDKQAIWKSEFQEDSKLSWQLVEEYYWTDGQNSFKEHRVPNYFAPRPQNIADLCTGKYEPLKTLFQGLTSADLKSIKENELVQVVEPTQKILMLAFYRNVLQPLTTGSAPVSFDSLTFRPDRPKEDASSSPHLATDLLSKRLVLNLQKKVISKMFAGVDKSRIPANELRNKLLATFNSSTTLDIDLSKCQLNDIDMQFVVETVDSFPNCIGLNLSLNQFIGIPNPDVDANLIYLLKKEKLDYVDITHNPIATIDRKDFFRELDEPLFKKLIWIPKQYLEGEQWRIMVPPYKYDVVYTTHLKYYNTVNKLM